MLETTQEQEQEQERERLIGRNKDIRNKKGESKIQRSREINKIMKNRSKKTR